MSEKEILIKVLLNTIKMLLNSTITGVKDICVDHETKNYNIKIEITER